MIFVLDIITLARSVTIGLALPFRDLNNSLTFLCQQSVTDVKVILYYVILNAEYVAIHFIIGTSSCCLELECSKFINCEHKLFSTLEFYREMVTASSSVADKCFTWFCERGLG